MVAGSFLASRPGIQVTPGESIEPRVWAGLDRIGNERSQDRRELHGVPTPAGGDEQAVILRVPIDPQVLVQGVAVEAPTCVDSG